jgi:hypothetical protein
MKARKRKTPSKGKTTGKRGPVRDLSSRSARVRGGSAEQLLRLQMTMEQLPKVNQTLLNLMKSGDSGGILNNLK